MSVKSDVVFSSALELAEKLRSGELTSEELTRAFLDRISEVDSQINAFLFVDEDGALETAREVDAARKAGEDLHPLAGVPIAIKDNIVTRGVPTTAASKILEGWLPPYDATVIRKIKDAKLPIIGKTNMDEFAMGSSTEYSAFGPTHNPWDPERIPGGSGGGSAAAVAAFMVPFALGSDTGGSIRQPGAVTGTVGVKPTYGAVSRYGAIALASSMDQVGPVARTVADAAALQDLIAGYDAEDPASLPHEWTSMLDAVESFKPQSAPSQQSGDLAAVPEDESADLTGLKVGVVKQLAGDGYEPGVFEQFQRALEHLKFHGAEIVEVDVPNFDHALAAYYVIMPAEASSNLARFDGIRFGARVEPKEGPITSERLISATRGACFGEEVKRRIIFGTHILSSGNFEKYFVGAQKIRTLVMRDFDSAFEKVDVLVSPTSATTAFKFGDHALNPTQMYLNDIATIPANLAGVPAMSVPCGLSNGLPVGFQVIAPARGDDVMYRVARAVEIYEDVVGLNPKNTRGEDA
ncbi:MAG: Asp-tRNA(Asn)/Glu-tRNA(Gln) amidotransferase subunit GatA [Gleimia sp.]|jgi:aspartyl-tRNA(Asn)/glutamyl-tRNA(Gln) amidotransferase subunit A|nr:Asp-tRNA(Asn)/Glu-tRNA(Gln) amidotransferase subunit GatA [Acidobacteriota bacterium]